MNSESFGSKVLNFYMNLTLSSPLPHGINILNPYQSNSGILNETKLFLQNITTTTIQEE
ncbi:MAG: hypothetical protein HC906_18720 [Bacteroidales bacterium]|nr:hypothetical protein [Bacteroidales bacterium]